MLDRNRRIKTCPERFQSSPDQFNIIITCEERVYDQVIESEFHFFHVVTDITSSSLQVLRVGTVRPPLCMLLTSKSKTTMKKQQLVLS